METVSKEDPLVPSIKLYNNLGFQRSQFNLVHLRYKRSILTYICIQIPPTPNPQFSSFLICQTRFQLLSVIFIASCGLRTQVSSFFVRSLFSQSNLVLHGVSYFFSLFQDALLLQIAFNQNNARKHVKVRLNLKLVKSQNEALQSLMHSFQWHTLSYLAF